MAVMEAVPAIPAWYLEHVVGDMQALGRNFNTHPMTTEEQAAILTGWQSHKSPTHVAVALAGFVVAETVTVVRRYFADADDDSEARP